MRPPYGHHDAGDIRPAHRLSVSRNESPTAVAPGPPAPLERHLVLDTDDVDEARERVGRVFCPHSLRLVHRGDRLRARQYAARIGDITLSWLGYDAEVEIVAGPRTSFFSVQLPATGAAEIACGRQQIVSTPAVASVPTPVEQLRMRWDRRAQQIIVKVDETALERYLAQMLGYTPPEPLRPRLGLALESEAGMRWPAIHALLLNELALADSGQGSHASRALVQELVMGSLLLTHPSNYSTQLRADRGGAGPRYVRRAMEYASARLDHPLTVAELAEAAGVSVRALQQGFRQAIGCSPLSWLRDRRLERARDELRAAQPGDGTLVTDVALRWGFSHFGRFAQLYARRFGERPSETLRR